MFWVVGQNLLELLYTNKLIEYEFYPKLSLVTHNWMHRFRLPWTAQLNPNHNMTNFYL